MTKQTGQAQINAMWQQHQEWNADALAGQHNNPEDAYVQRDELQAQGKPASVDRNGPNDYQVWTTGA